MYISSTVQQAGNGKYRIKHSENEKLSARLPGREQAAGIN
jgi:hypothetical protein